MTALLKLCVRDHGSLWRGWSDLQVRLKCPIHPTEDVELVKSAMESILGTTELESVEEEDQGFTLTAVWNRQQNLAILRQGIHDRRIIDAVRSRLLANWDGAETHIRFDKQAGSTGRVRLIDDDAENPPLGYISLNLSFDSETSFGDFLKWFVPPTQNGRIVDP
jgi:predicted RNA binding protein with dsRBD fold (UPF0201 family)